MKKLFSLIAILMLVNADAQTNAQDHRILAAAAVASHYLNNRSSPAVIYLDCNGGLSAKEVLSLVRVKPASGVVKAGNNSEIKGRELVEKGTALSCEVFLLSPQEFGNEKATFKVYWDGPNLESTTYLAILKFMKDKWEVVEDRIVLVP